MVTPRLRLLGLVAVILAAADGAASQDQAVQDTVAAKRVREWLTAVEQHQPGRVDDALDRIRTWTDEQLRILSQDLARLLRTRNPPLETSLLKLDVPDVRARVLRRGAMLHADAGMLASSSTVPGAGGDGARPLAGLLLDDGRGAGLTRTTFHWLLGRQLVDALTESGAVPDEFVNLWYRATTAVMLATADYATVEPHLIHAQRLLPTRAHVWLSAGVVHAYFATPAVQNASLALKLPEGYSLRVGDERRELALAEQSFRRAIGLKEDDAEARLRLGRVLAQQQRHQEALIELGAAGAIARDLIQQYYVHLFAGQSAAELGQHDRAAASFKRAAALYPDAQTPLVALSELAVRRGDRSAAAAALQGLVAGSADRSPGSDPWWAYDVSYARDANTLVGQLRSWLATEHR
jgi:tetratricopeptide (TPR) repeat protein